MSKIQKKLKITFISSKIQNFWKINFSVKKNLFRFSILGIRDLTRALQFSPILRRRKNLKKSDFMGVVWAWQRDKGRKSSCLILDVLGGSLRLRNISSAWIRKRMNWIHLDKELNFFKQEIFFQDFFILLFWKGQTGDK